MFWDWVSPCRRCFRCSFHGPFKLVCSGFVFFLFVCFFFGEIIAYNILLCRWLNSSDYPSNPDWRHTRPIPSNGHANALQLDSAGRAEPHNNIRLFGSWCKCRERLSVAFEGIRHPIMLKFSILCGVFSAGHRLFLVFGRFDYPLLQLAAAILHFRCGRYHLVYTFCEWRGAPHAYEPTIEFIVNFSNAFLYGQILLCSDSPACHPLIKEDEKEHILAKLGQLERKKDQSATPWGEILTSKPVMAFILALVRSREDHKNSQNIKEVLTIRLKLQIFNNWAYNVLSTTLPKYMNDVLRFSIQDIGLFNSLPWLVRTIFSYIFGYFIDKAIVVKMITVTNARKLAVALCNCHVRSKALIGRK